MFNRWPAFKVLVGLTVGEKGRDLTGFSHVNVMRVAGKAVNTVQASAPTEEGGVQKEQAEAEQHKHLSRRPSRQLPRPRRGTTFHSMMKPLSGY